MKAETKEILTDSELNWVAFTERQEVKRGEVVYSAETQARREAERLANLWGKFPTSKQIDYEISWE